MHCITFLSKFSSAHDVDFNRPHDNTRKVLRCAILHNPPYDVVIRAPNGSFTWRGGSKSMVFWLAERLNYSLELLYPTEEEVKLRGLEATIDLVARKEADFVGTGLVVTPTRLEAIDAGTSVAWEEAYRLVVPIPDEEDRLFAFIRPFDTAVWILLALSVSVIVTAMSLFSWTYDRLESRNRTTTRSKTTLRDYFESYFFYNLNVLTNHCDHLKLTHVKPFLICVGTWLMGASILVYGYSRVVVSSLTVPKTKPPVNSLHDLLTSKDVSILIRSDVVMGQLILTSEAPIYKALREKVARDPHSLITRNTSVINELLLNGKHAYPYVETFVRFFIANEYKKSGKCRNKLSQRIPTSINFFYIFFRKGSSIAREFSIAGMELWETGQTRFWVNNELPKADVCFAPTRTKGVRQAAIKLADLTSAFFILGVGIALALFTFVIELFVKRLRTRGALRAYRSKISPLR